MAEWALKTKVCIDLSIGKRLSSAFFVFVSFLFCLACLSVQEIHIRQQSVSKPQNHGAENDPRLSASANATQPPKRNEEKHKAGDT